MPANASTPRWKKQRIVAYIQGLKDRGEDLSYNRIASKRAGLLSAANYHFGSWRRAVEAAGIDYARGVRRIPKWTKDKIVGTIRAARDSSVDLSWTNVSKHPRYSGMAYAAIRNSRFGSWDEALRAAGINPSQVRRYESWSQEKVIRQIRERAAAGKELNSKAMQQEDCKLFNAALKRYEGWDRALAAAGVDPQTVYKRRRWSKELIRRDIKEVRARGENLAAPAMRASHPALYSAACKYFGSWVSARRASGVRGNFRRRKGK